MAAVVAAAATTEHARPPPPACSASCAVASLVFEAMEGGRGEGAGGPADLSQDMAACESRIAQGRSRTAEADSAFDGAILCARSLAQCGGTRLLRPSPLFHLPLVRCWSLGICVSPLDCDWRRESAYAAMIFVP
ncbi:hypothetical protein ZWY2020_035658 [Hordeum vulgare]|nr:hypothetical protein ZWY2020_035658 [Hordeum vulgare]